MKIVIPCASRKVPVEGGDFEGFMRGYKKDKPVKFVADPNHCELKFKDSVVRYAHPDEADCDGVKFREKLCAYNEEFNSDGCNPHKLLPAYKLYNKSIYSKLVDSYGIDRTYILSAGWGIVRADFLLPMYDITFSSRVGEKYKKRKSSDVWLDFNHLGNECEDTLCLFGTANYIDLFLDLTSQYKGKRIVYCKSGRWYPSSETLKFVKCNLSARTNWQNICAEKKMRNLCNTSLECSV